MTADTTPVTPVRAPKTRDISLTLPSRMLIAELVTGALEGKPPQECVRAFKRKCIPSRVGDQWQKSYGRQVERLVEEADRSLAKSGIAVVGRYPEGMGLTQTEQEQSRALAATLPQATEADYEAALSELDLDAIVENALGADVSDPEVKSKVVQALLADDPVYQQAQLALANTRPLAPGSLRIEHRGLPVAAAKLASALTAALAVDIEDVLAEPPLRQEHPLFDPKGLLGQALDEYLACPTHPFFRTLDWPEGDPSLPAGRYLLLGSAEGTFRKGKHAGDKGVVSFKVGVPTWEAGKRMWTHAYSLSELLAPKIDGREVKLSATGADGWTRTLRLLRPEPAASYKLWVNVISGSGTSLCPAVRRDDLNGYRTIMPKLDGEGRVEGWQVVPEQRGEA